MKIQRRHRPEGPALVLAFAFAFAAFLLADAARAQGLSLKPPSLANVHGRITARFGVTVEELPILKGELEDGIELVLTCDVGLFRVNSYWLDDRLAAAAFVSTLGFDPLTREYLMRLPRTAQPMRGKDLGELLDRGWGKIEIGLGSWALLDRGVKYRLRLKTSMNDKDAPEGVMRYIYFWSWSPGSDNSFQLDFTY